MLMKSKKLTRWAKPLQNPAFVYCNKMHVRYIVYKHTKTGSIRLQPHMWLFAFPAAHLLKY